MTGLALSLRRVARQAYLASRAAAAGAAHASRAARAAALSRAAVPVAHAAVPPPLGRGLPLRICPIRGEPTTIPREGAPDRYTLPANYEQLPDDAKTPTDKDFESDEAFRSLYERWCKAFNKERDQRDPAEMNLRLKLFTHAAKAVHAHNTYVPPDPEEAAIYRDKRAEAKLLVSKGEDVSHLDECYLPEELGPYADGGDPYFDFNDINLLKTLEEEEASSGKSQT